MSKDNKHLWILYITIPLTIIVIIICLTMIYLNMNSYPVNISMSLDNNMLEAYKLIYNTTNTSLI